MLVAYESLARAGELAAIQVEDVFLKEVPAKLLIPRSKADIEGLGRWVELSADATGAVRDWVDASGIKSGALLRRVRGNYIGSQGLDVSSVGRMLKRRQRVVEGAGAGEVSGHSFRVGGAQRLLREGKSDVEIMIRGGWQSYGALVGYLR